MYVLGFLFVSLVLFVLLLVYGLFYLANQRKEAWKTAGKKVNFQFFEKDSAEERFPGFKIFTLGRNRNSYNILIGTSGIDDVCIFDYAYTTGSGKASQTHYQTLCIITSKDLSLPHFFIRGESSLFDFLGKLFGNQDINFAEDPEFSKAFIVQGEDELAVRELFNARIRREFFQFEKTSIQIEGRDNIILLNTNEYINPEHVPSFIQKTIGVKKMFCPV